LIIIVVVSFSLTSIATLIAFGKPITREAIEISRNTWLVQSFLKNAERYTLEVHYKNETQSGISHGIWYITWYIHPVGAPSAFAYFVSHSIDAVTGRILDEGVASLR
jgi:hypothetical protein